MESPAIHPESPMEQDEVPFPCMGCGEVRIVLTMIPNAAD
jgi:hypothetical protein